MPDGTHDRVLDLLAGIRSGDIQGRAIDKGTRRRCVEYMTLEGAATAEIAKALDVSDRTVRRDLEIIRVQRTLECDPQLTGEIAGELLVETRASMSRLKRIARDPQTPPGVKVEAERSSVQILDQTIERLQRLGFVATAPVQVEASVSHTLDDSQAVLAQIQELKRLASLAAGEEREALDAMARSLQRSLPSGDGKGGEV
ncbi:MAG: ECF-type sigma factor [Planctomycetota bacterium]